MIRYDTWINNTKNPSKRTTELVNVDNALRTYQPTPTHLKTLTAAFDAWKKKKANWKDSDRYKKATGFPNAVQQLHDDLVKANTTPPPSVSVLLSPLGPRPPG